MKLRVQPLFALFSILLAMDCFAQDPRFEYDPTYSIKKFKQTSRHTCRPYERPNRRNKCKYYRKFEAELLTINPLDESDYVIPFHLYKTNKPGNNPLILIVPPLGGMTRVDKDLAIFFANKGINSLIAINPENIADVNRPIEDIDGFLIRTTVAMRLLLDFAEDQKYIDTTQIGAFGASLGGIRLLSLIGVDDRIDASVVYVGAGNMPEVLANSQQPVIKNYRQHKMDKLKFGTDQEYLDALKATVTVDPLDNISYFSPDNVFLKISNKDTHVPTANQWETQKAINTPHFKSTNNGHVRSVVDAMFFKSDMYNFITKRW
jgi:hypothetical protein